MTREEKSEINALEPRFRPLSAWSYFGYSVLFNLPLIGLIFLIYFSFSKNNVNLRNFARSYFCVLILALVIVVILFVSGLAMPVIAYVLGIIFPNGL